jgi:hypothetical protein
VVEIDPTTVLSWLVEAAEHLHAFSAYFLHELPLTQVQLDELYAVLSAVRDGDMSEARPLSVSRNPVWSNYLNSPFYRQLPRSVKKLVVFQMCTLVLSPF